MNRSINGLFFGGLLYCCEAIQSILLIPLFKSNFGENQTLIWIGLLSSVGLVSFAYSAYYQPLIREYSTFFDLKSNSILPANFDAIRRKSLFWGNCVLLISFSIFIFFFLYKWGAGWLLVLTVLFYALSLYFKLLAFNNFILFISRKEVGLDKLMLLKGSFLSLCLYLVVAIFFKNIIALAIVSLISSYVVFLLSENKIKMVLGVSTYNSDYRVDLNKSEMYLILFLNLGGYLKLNTDVLLSSYFLTPSQSLQFVFWAKIFYMLLALVGLWSQIRFPFWSSFEKSSSVILREVRLVMVLFFLLELLIVLVYFIFRKYDLVYFNGLINSDIKFLLLLFASIFLASYTFILDQVLMAKKIYSHLYFIIIISVLTPLLSICASIIYGPYGFIWGYLISHFILLIVDFLRVDKLKRKEILV